MLVNSDDIYMDHTDDFNDLLKGSYLDIGIANERMKITKVAMRKNEVICDARNTIAFIGENDEHHISGLSSFFLVHKLIVAYSIIDNNLTADRKDLILKNISCEYKKMITDFSLDVHVTIDKKKVMRNIVLYVATASVNNGSHVYKGKFFQTL